MVTAIAREEQEAVHHLVRRDIYVRLDVAVPATFRTRQGRPQVTALGGRPMSGLLSPIYAVRVAHDLVGPYIPTLDCGSRRNHPIGFSIDFSVGGAL
jgi:hypothetical protein